MLVAEVRTAVRFRSIIGEILVSRWFYGRVEQVVSFPRCKRDAFLRCVGSIPTSPTKGCINKAEEDLRLTVNQLPYAAIRATRLRPTKGWYECLVHWQWPLPETGSKPVWTVEDRTLTQPSKEMEKMICGRGPDYGSIPFDLGRQRGSSPLHKSFYGSDGVCW